MDKTIQALIDAPLADAAKINVPFGKRPTKRGPRATYYDSADDGGMRLNRAQVQERKVEAYSKKLCSVLDYYASSSVPVERVAEHTGLSIEQATEAMKRRGREI